MKTAADLRFFTLRSRTVLRRTLPAAGLVLALFTAGCGRQPARNPEARTESLRVVSLAPNLTEIICAVGGAPYLVGRTSVCNYPLELIKDVPVVGDFGAPSLERLLLARPTLVLEVDLADDQIARRLDEAGIARHRITCRRLDEIPRAILEIGRLLGCDAQAQIEANRFRHEMERFRQNQQPPEQRPLVLAEIWSDPLMIVGRASIVSDLIALAGGRNLGDDLEKDYAEASPEWILIRDPEIILCLYDTGGREPRDMVAGRTGWSGVRAVRQGRIYGGFNLDLMLKPGPRILESVPQIAACFEKSPIPR